MSACGRRIIAGAAASPTARICQVSQRQPAIANELWRVSGNQIDRRRGIILQSPRQSRRWVIEAVGPGGKVSVRNDGGDEEKKVGPCAYAVGDQEVRELVQERRVENDDRRVEVVVAAAVTVVLGVGNRVLYKLALVPLKHYPFFLAQLATFG
ncbi:unnamed protein product, partial [Ilex paraguariensis]